jgi:hypothetical protein
LQHFELVGRAWPPGSSGERGAGGVRADASHHAGYFAAAALGDFLLREVERFFAGASATMPVGAFGRLAAARSRAAISAISSGA